MMCIIRLALRHLSSKGRATTRGGTFTRVGGSAGEDRGIRDSRAGVVEATANVAEAKMLRCLRDGGADNLTGPAYKHDFHKDAANALGKGDAYQSMKILADNAIRPQSVERWMEVDKLWRELKQEIQDDWLKTRSPLTTYLVSCENKFKTRIAVLNKKGKLTNSAAISDGLRYGGKSPVNVRPFNFEERIKEALQEVS